MEGIGFSMLSGVEENGKKKDLKVGRNEACGARSTRKVILGWRCLRDKKK